MGLRLVHIIFGICCYFSLYGQINQGDYAFKKMDKHAQSTPESVTKNIQELTEYLIEPALNDYEKIRGIYTWIVINIEYDKEAYNSDFYRLNQSNRDILERKKAICFGYAKLLEAMCQFAAIPSYLVIGYAKGTHSSSANYDEINHSWNAVNLDGKWYLIDATWAAGSRLSNGSFTIGNSYFLTNPKVFINNHLPAYSIWQLLDCPIDFKTFRQPNFIFEESIENKNCFNYEDSISYFMKLPSTQQSIKTMEQACLENSNSNNIKELAQTYMDLEGQLSEKVEKLQLKGLEDSIYLIQSKMIMLCQKASKLSTLYEYQIENCAYTYMNQGVAISRKEKLKKEDLELMLFYFQKAQSFLELLPNTMFVKQGIAHCKNYIEYTNSELKTY